MYNYLIKTKDTTLTNYIIDDILKDFNDEYEKFYYELSKNDLLLAIREINTSSFFDSNKMIIIKDIDNQIDNITFDQDFFKTTNNELLNHILVIITYQDKESANLLELKKYFMFKEYIVDDELKNKYIKNILSNEFTLDEEAKELLLFYSKDLLELKNNLDKLIAYKYDNKRITNTDVNLLVYKPVDDDLFMLVEAFLKKDKNLCYELYNEFRKRNIQTTLLIQLLILKYIDLYNTKILVDYKLDQNQIASIAQVKSGKAYYMIKAVANVSIDDVKHMLKELISIENEIKKGHINDVLAFSLLIINC